jgi:chaperonin GroES
MATATATAAKRSTFKLKPIGDRVIAERLGSSEKTKSGLYLPDTAQEKPQEALVVAVGTGKVLKSGKRVEPQVKVGDKVIFAKYSGSDIKVEGKEYVFLSEDEILAVVA